MAFLDGRPKPLIETVLWTMMDHPVGSGDEELGWHRDGAGIGYDALRRRVKFQQDVDRNGPRDQRVRFVRLDALAIMRRSGAHLARVFDEHGTATGVLFLEDIIEELVGEVQDATRRD